MKKLWNILAVMAIANLLAITGFVGWLSKSGRLNAERVQAIRAMVSRTVADEAAEKAAAEKKAQDDAEAAKLAAAASILPVRATEKIEQLREGAEIELQNKLRLANELRLLQEFLVRENERLVTLERDLKAREESFAEERKRIDDTEGAEQFKKALATLGGVKAKEAQTMLSELITAGKQDQVVAYLNSMEERQRSKVLSEFNKVDPKMAADLLEQLRRYGVGMGAAEAPPNVPVPPPPGS